MPNPDFVYHAKLLTSGFTTIGGIDEAGRGPWAGPVSAGCVVIDSESQRIDGVTDSKKLSAKKRDELFEQIKQNSTAWGVGLVSAQEIDEIGIQKAVQKTMMLAVAQVEAALVKVGRKVDYLLVDGNGVLDLPNYNMEKFIKGDSLHYVIAAGSILAKVTRDRLMIDFSLKYPEYGFEKHMGYGTKAHIEALQKFGACEIHRKSYKPIAKLCK